MIAFSSIAARKGYSFHSQVGISKGALEGLVVSLAAELSPNIRVNAIAPSITDTPLADRLLNTDAKREANAERHPLKRIGSAQEVAQLASHLLCEHGSWITGQVIAVDGGMGALRTFK